MLADQPLGRPPFEPTDDQRRSVYTMAACGITQMQIAAVLEISDETLRKYFRRELDTAAIEANTKVAHTLFAKAISGDVGAAVWWTKARMGWKEKQEIAHTDAEGNNIAITLVAAPKRAED